MQGYRWRKKCTVSPVHAMKKLPDSGGMAPFILNLGPRWGECSVSKHSRFALGKRTQFN